MCGSADALDKAARDGFWSVSIRPSVMPRERSVDIDDRWISSGPSGCIGGSRATVKLMTMKRVFVIAEAGVNHNGSLEWPFGWSKRRAPRAQTP